MTIKKQGYRTVPLINPTSNDVENYPSLPNWMSDFAKNIAKTSVQSRKKDESIYDQITSIMNTNKSKYSSVEDVVRDMQERSGIIDYQNKIKSMAQAIKNAACSCEEKDHDHSSPHKNEKPQIKIFTMKPQIKETFDNYIEDTKGNLPIPAIIEKIKGIHRNDITDDASWDDDGLMQYVNEKCIDVKKMYPDDDTSNAGLGKIPHYDDKDIDPSNDDALFSLEPASIK